MSSAEHVLYRTEIFLVKLCIFLEFRPRVGVNAFAEGSGVIGIIITDRANSLKFALVS